MVGYRNHVTLGTTICSALCAAGAAWGCWDESPGLAGFFAAIVVASGLFWMGRRGVLSVLVAGNLAFCTVACMYLVSGVRSRQVDFWPPLAAVVLAPALAAIACYLWGGSYCQAAAAACARPAVRRRAKQAMVLALAALGGLAGTAGYERAIQRQAAELERAIARVRSGVTAAEADRLIGRKPDQVAQTSGVLLNGVTLLAATNAKAAAYGPPQPYEARIWQRGDVKACVIIDRSGLVVGRYSRRGGR